jgi:hypothetical protein
VFVLGEPVEAAAEALKVQQTFGVALVAAAVAECPPHLQHHNFHQELLLP